MAAGKALGIVLSLAALYYLGSLLTVRVAYGTFLGFVLMLGAALLLLAPPSSARQPPRRWRWFVRAGAAALAVAGFLLADRAAHSVSDTLIAFLPLLGFVASVAWCVTVRARVP